MSAKLTDAEIQQLAAHWWQQHDKPPEPWPEPQRLVSFSALPAAGEGAIEAAVIRETLRNDGYSDDVLMTFGFWPCENGCGKRINYGSETDGRCSTCLGESDSYSLDAVHEACAQLRAEVELNPRIQAARAEADRLLARSRRTVAVPAFAKGR